MYRAVHLETDMVLAIKELPNLVNQEELKKEIDILKKVGSNLAIYNKIYDLFFANWEAVNSMFVFLVFTPEYCMLLWNLPAS